MVLLKEMVGVTGLAGYDGRFRWAGDHGFVSFRSDERRGVLNVGLGRTSFHGELTPTAHEHSCSPMRRRALS